MKHIQEYIFDYQYDMKVLEEMSVDIAEETINESFKSSILQALAEAIFNAEKERNKQKVEIAKENDKKYPRIDGTKHTPSLVNFASIFGPQQIPGKYTTRKRLQGLKWSEITDDDFKEFAPNDPALIKLVKQTYRKKDKYADFIIMTKDNKVINFIKAYSKDEHDDGVFYFKISDSHSSIEELVKRKYSYSSRSLNTNEVVEFLNDIANIEGLKVYALEINSSMIQDYKLLGNERELSKEGMIEYDQASLKKILKEQQVKYRMLADEIRAKKLQQNPNVLFDDIKKCNEEIIELYTKIINNPDNLDANFDIGRLITYSANAYETFYRAMKSKRSGELANEKHGKSYGKFDLERADMEINDAKSYLERAKKEIEQLKQKVK